MYAYVHKDVYANVYVNVYVHVYVYVCVYVYAHVSMYIYRYRYVPACTYIQICVLWLWASPGFGADYLEERPAPQEAFFAPSASRDAPGAEAKLLQAVQEQALRGSIAKTGSGIRKSRPGGAHGGSWSNRAVDADGASVCCTLVSEAGACCTSVGARLDIHALGITAIEVLCRNL